VEGAVGMPHKFQERPSGSSRMHETVLAARALGGGGYSASTDLRASLWGLVAPAQEPHLAVSAICSTRPYIAGNAGK